MYSTCELYVFCQFKHDRKNGVKKILSLEVQSAAEFSSNPDQTHLPVIY